MHAERQVWEGVMRVYDGLAAWFLVVLAGTGAAAAPVSFNGTPAFLAGNSPRSVAASDFNGDGNQDLAVANYASNNVSILLGNGQGGFPPATSGRGFWRDEGV
jgi:hypothetical protein